MIKIEFFLFILNQFKGTAMQFKKLIWLLRYVNQNSKNFALRLRMNLLQFSGTKEACTWQLSGITFFWFEITNSGITFFWFERNRCKTKTKPHSLWSLLSQSMKLRKCITQELFSLHPQCQAILQWVTSILSAQRL